MFLCFFLLARKKFFFKEGEGLCFGPFFWKWFFLINFFYDFFFFKLGKNSFSLITFINDFNSLKLGTNSVVSILLGHNCVSIDLLQSMVNETKRRVEEMDQFSFQLNSRQVPYGLDQGKRLSLFSLI